MLNLIDDPVIPVVGEDGPEELSIRDTLRRASELVGIQAAQPTMEAALTLLPVAILVRALSTEGVVALDRWGDIWESGEFPQEVFDYLDVHRERFNLRDPDAPFLQTSGLSTVKGPQSLDLIVPGSGEGLFTIRRHQALDAMEPAEAARWLITANAYDVSGIKTPATGDPRAKGGKVYPSGTGWAGTLGLHLLQGATLFETLMLNLRLNPDDAVTDTAAWERPVPGPLAERDGTPARGPADLLTWPSRRLLLEWDDEGRAVGVTLTYGDRVDLAGSHSSEWFSRWQLTKASQVMFPRRHMAGQRRWSGLASLLVHSAGQSEMPRIFGWLGELREAEIIPAALPIKVRALGVIYGTQDAVVTDLVEDTYTARVATITTPALREVVIAAADKAEAVSTLVGNYAGNLARAGGQEPDGFRAEAKARIYELLEPEFDDWLDTLVDPEASPSYTRDWLDRCRRTARRVVDEMDPSISPAAITGRVLKVGQNEFYSDAGSIRSRFFVDLSKQFPREGEQ